jgi:hypothetical protein
MLRCRPLAEERQHTSAYGAVPYKSMRNVCVREHTEQYPKSMRNVCVREHTEQYPKSMRNVCVREHTEQYLKSMRNAPLRFSTLRVCAMHRCAVEQFLKTRKAAFPLSSKHSDGSKPLSGSLKLPTCLEPTGHHPLDMHPACVCCALCTE